MSFIPKPVASASFCLKILIHVSCHWQRMHQGPHVIGHFLSTSAHYLGGLLRKSLEFLGTCICKQKVSSLLVTGSHPWPSTRIFCGVPLQLIYSHCIDSILVPWGPLSLSVVPLSSLNDLHNWLVIIWYLSCLTPAY